MYHLQHRWRQQVLPKLVPTYQTIRLNNAECQNLTLNPGKTSELTWKWYRLNVAWRCTSYLCANKLNSSLTLLKSFKKWELVHICLQFTYWSFMWVSVVKQAGILSVWTNTVEIWNTDTFKWKDFYWQLTCFTIIII